MSEENEVTIEDLQAEATELGIKFHPAIGKDNLAEKIAVSKKAYLEAEEEEKNYQIEQDNEKELAAEKAEKIQLQKEADDKNALLVEEAKKIIAADNLRKEEAEEKTSDKKINPRVKARQDALKLVRCIVSCHNPLKSSLQGELKSAANSFSGSVQIMVVYDTEWHIPAIIVNSMKESQIKRYTRKKDKNDNEITQYRLVPEYSIQILPQLTDAELAALRKEQERKAGIEATAIL